MLFQAARLAVGVFLALAIEASGLQAQIPAPPAEQNDPCGRINRILIDLSKAERDEATALRLYSQGGDPAIVESRLNRVLALSNQLRILLHRVADDSPTGDATVAQCRKVGYEALYKAERVSADVEHILARGRGHPQATLTPVPKTAARTGE